MTHESRPKAAPDSLAADSSIAPTTDLASLSRAELDLWLDGYVWGRVGCGHEDYARGRRDEAEEMAAYQRRAMSVVHRAADAVLMPNHAADVLLTRDERIARDERAAERLHAKLREAS